MRTVIKNIFSTRKILSSKRYPSGSLHSLRSKDDPVVVGPGCQPLSFSRGRRERPHVGVQGQVDRIGVCGLWAPKLIQLRAGSAFVLRGCAATCGELGGERHSCLVAEADWGRFVLYNLIKCEFRRCHFNDGTQVARG